MQVANSGVKQAQEQNESCKCMGSDKYSKHTLKKRPRLGSTWLNMDMQSLYATAHEFKQGKHVQDTV